MVIHDRAAGDVPLEPAEIAAKGDLREKNQVTVPKQIVDAMGLHPGDTLLFLLDPNDTAVVHVHRMPASYAGTLAGVYGSPEEIRVSLEHDREAWGE
jgi:AbrB family looped-hinge helix DNA binding protein